MCRLRQRGDKSLPKERLEIFGGSRTFVLDDYRRATLHKDGREEQVTLKAQDKGQQEQVRRVVQASSTAQKPQSI
jgi:polar amino acid transport system substrate-binding protein